MACVSRGVTLRRVWHRVSSWSRDVFYGGCQEKNLLFRCPRGLAMLHYKAFPPYFPPRVNWISADKIPEPPLYTTSMKPVPKLWYYDPEPCSKYKSYYPYLGQVICRDTIIVPTKYLWE